MTLLFEVHQIINLKDPNSKEKIALKVIRGNQEMYISEISDKKMVWNPSFSFACSSKDYLKFVVVSEKQTANQKQLHSKIPPKTVGMFDCPTFLKIKKDKLSKITPFKHQIDLMENEQHWGSISVSIRYDPAKFYEGELSSNPFLSTTHDVILKQIVPIYIGKCQTRNCFSFLDQSTDGQLCKFSESIYRDHQ